MVALHTDWPGKELQPFYRSICQRLVREQGWRYRRPQGRGYPRLLPPDPDQPPLSIALTPSEYRGRLNWISELRRRGANLDDPTPDQQVREIVPTFSDAPAMQTETQDGPSRAEWWQSIGGEDWWRYRYGDEMPPPAPEPVVDHRVDAMLAKLKPKPKPKVDLEDKSRNPAYTLREVRAMFRRGYPIAQVVRITGWGAYWIADMAGPDGYCRVETEGMTG